MKSEGYLSKKGRDYYSYYLIHEFIRDKEIELTALTQQIILVLVYSILQYEIMNMVDENKPVNNKTKLKKGA
jgi:hypothetical protein